MPPVPRLPAIHVIRQRRVMIDAELARLFGVPTEAFNQAVRRNAGRFPTDFIFKLTAQEHAALTQGEGFVGGKSAGRGRHRKYPAWAFTEHGAIMAAMVLRSPRAVAMSVYVVRAFVRRIGFHQGNREV